MKRTVAILAMLLVSTIVPVSAFAGAADQQAYTGSHVAFDTQSTAVVDYTVDGKQTVDAVRVQSQSKTDASLGVSGSVDLTAVADMVGAALSLDAKTEANASLTTESGARIQAHDNGHGSLVVTAADESQYVALNLSGAQTEQVSDQRVVFTSASGTTSTAMVVGAGNVTVTESGNMTASLAEDSRLVVRAYGDGRTEDDETQEQMIVNETAAASVYVMNQGGEAVTDTVAYGQDTTVTVEERAESKVNMTVSRTASEGRVVITHVSNETFESADDVQVSVDGKAAASASSYAELRSATEGGDTSKYMVEQSSSTTASADVDVIVGINHFSTRNVTMTETSSGDGSDDTTDESTPDSDSDNSDGTTNQSGDSDSTETADSDSTETADSDSTETADSDSNDAGDGDSTEKSAATTTGNGPGFGIVLALVAFVAGIGLAARRRQ